MPVEMKKIMAVFLTVIALWFSCHSKRSKNILVKVLSGMFSLENVAPWKRRTNPWWVFVGDIGFAIAGMGAKGMPKRWVILTFYAYC